MLELLLDLNFSFKRFFHLWGLQRQLVDFLNCHCDVGGLVHSQLYHAIGSFTEALIVKDKVFEGHLG